MSGGSSYQTTFGRQVREQLGGVGRRIQWNGSAAHHAVLGVLVRHLAARGGPSGAGDVTAGTVLSRRLVAALGLMAGFAGARARAPGSRRGGRRRSPSPSALKNEVDSFNPFLGYEAPSYEMWALTYDYMVGYSMDDMSPGARARDDVGDLRGRQDLDLRHPRGREVVRRRAVHGRRHRLHLQPGPRRRDVEGGALGLLPDVGRVGARRPTTPPWC